MNSDCNKSLITLDLESCVENNNETDYKYTKTTLQS